MSAAANANVHAMRAEVRRAIAGGPSNGNALSMLQGIMDDIVVAEVNVVNPSGASAAPSFVDAVSGTHSASFTPSASGTLSIHASTASSPAAVSHVSAIPSNIPTVKPSESASAATSPLENVAAKSSIPEAPATSASSTPSATHPSSISPASSSASHSSATSLVRDETSSSVISTSSHSPTEPAPTSTNSSASSLAKTPSTANTAKVSSTAALSQTPSTQRAEPASVPATSSSVQASLPTSSPSPSAQGPSSSSSGSAHTAQTTAQNSGGSVNSAEPATPASASVSGASVVNGGSAASPPTNSGNGFIATSTTQHVASTLAKPVSSTVTGAHSTFVTTPAFVTSVSVQTGSNGLPDQTFTSVFANPTKVVGTGTDAIDNWSFFDSKGNIAAVVVAVLASIAVVFLGVFCFRRQKRRWRARAQRLSDEWSRQNMMEQPTTYGAISNTRLPRDDPERHLMAPSLRSGENVGYGDTTLRRTNSLHSSEAHSSAQHVYQTTLGLSGVLPDMPKYEGPFSDYNRYPSFAGDTRVENALPEKLLVVPHALDFKPAAEATSAKGDEGRTSPTPSTPSIYPPSLPAVPEKDEDDYLFYERETRHRPSATVLPTTPPKARIVDSNAANPFSDPSEQYQTARSIVLQRSQTLPRVETGRAWRPLTPPDSTSGESTATTPTTAESAKGGDPFSNGFLGRRVSTKFERPARNPLRLSATSVTLNKWDDLTKDTTTPV